MEAREQKGEKFRWKSYSHPTLFSIKLDFGGNF
jgi:hypothetical protein